MTSPSLIHRPAPRVAVVFAMVLLASVVLPGPVIAPERFTLDVGTLIGLSVFVGFEVGLLAIFLRRVELFVEGPSLRMVSTRWPFSAETTTVARAAVAEVVLEPSGRGAVRLVLVMKDSTRVPVTRSYFGASAQTHRDLAALQGLVSSP